ncbi:autotransporter domain-containing protein [uncultured Desulfovibrio sp.]|uniref:autotransporter family protein n=1 Tax=uncultured Desulfovibrio sp. TaxID=167968 RepID=UPI002804CA9D|nr:autotransporter domain-containing protein [uncultured Desulfovibrio sp.]
MSTGNYLIAIDNTVFSKNEIHSEGNLRGSIINNQEDHKVTINSSSFESNISTVKGDYALGGAIYNEGELTFTGNNTFTDNIVNDKPNDIYNAGTITVKDGTTTLNSGLILAADSTTDVQGGALVVSGSTTWKAESAKMSLTKGALTLQKNDVLNGYEKLADQLTNEKQLTLQSGTLYLITDQDYTLDELTKAQTTLGIDSKNTFLGFQGGKLVDDQQSSKLQVNATANGTITGASNIQVGESAYTGVNTTLVESDLNVDAGSNTTVTITGNADVKVNSVDITADAAASVTIAGDSSTTGSLTVVGNGAGDKLVTSNGELANITVSDGGTFNMGIEGNSQAQGGQVGTVTVDGGTFNITGTAGQQSDYTVGELVLNDGLVNISNTSNAHSNSSTFNGGMLFLDPSYKATATNAPVQTILAIGEGSTLNVGFMDKATLRQAMINAGLAPNADLTVADTQSVLALGQSITLQGTGQIVLDDKVTPVETAPGSGNYEAYLPSGKVTDTAYFGDDSLLVVDGTKLGNNAAITASNGTAVIKDGAKLQLTNATKGSVTILSGFSNGIDIGTGWGNNTSVVNADRMLNSKLDVNNTAGSVTITNGVNRASDVLPGLDSDLDPLMASVWDNSLNDVNSDAMGVRFLSRAANSGYIADAGKAAATIESAARIAFAGAVPQMTKMASDAATNAVVNRLGFANPADGAQAMNAEGQIVDRNTTGFALWIAPLWQSQHGWGMEAGNLDYGFNGNLGGVSLGADYTFENAIRAGITFNIGGGYAETSGGDLNSTENRMTFWGLGAYAGWNYENFGLMADVSYTSTWNQLEQDLDPGMGMGDLEADVQATAISAGLRAEYKLETSVLDIIPHVGVRYMSLNTWGYDVDANGGTVMEGDGFHQDIWTFPVGVTFSKDITLDSGWFFKPSVDFSVIPAAGDIKAREDVRFTGAPAVAEMETQMMDYLTWQGGVGVQLGNDNLSFGVNYTLQAGQHTTGHGVFGNFRYEF